MRVIDKDGPALLLGSPANAAAPDTLLRGPQALAFLNATLTNDLRKLDVGQGQYTQMCNERGGVIECKTEAEIRAATEAHLARARKHRVQDQVITAERIVRPAL